MNFEITKSEYTKDKTGSEPMVPTSDLDIKIKQSWTENNIDKYYEKTLDFSSQQLPIDATVETDNKNELKYSFTIDKYMENGENASIKDKTLKLPNIKGWNDTIGVASHYSKAFYYYLNTINPKKDQKVNNI